MFYYVLGWGMQSPSVSQFDPLLYEKSKSYNSMVAVSMFISSILSNFANLCLTLVSFSLQPEMKNVFLWMFCRFFYDNPIHSVGRSAFQNLPELRMLWETLKFNTQITQHSTFIDLTKPVKCFSMFWDFSAWQTIE